MRILMFSWEYPPHVVGGLGSHVAELLPALAQQGISVDLITPRYAGGEPLEQLTSGGKDEGDITIHRVEPPEPQGDFYQNCQLTNRNLAEAAQHVIEHATPPFDAIHTHDWLVAFASIQIKHQYKLPLISTIHATEYGRNHGTIQGAMPHAIHGTEWQLTYESWRVIVTTNYMAKQVEDVFACPANKIDIIPNGIDTRRFDELEGEALSRFRSGYAAPYEKLVFSVGRVVYEKGAGVLLDAVPLVLKQMGNVKFVVAGTGPMLAQLRQRSEELGVADSIFFTGFVSDEARDRLFVVADAAVFPSLYEPFGIVALEAMAARTPVIVSNTGGLGEVVQHSETGIWVYPGNPESLAWGILHTLEHPEWARMRAEQAYRIVKAKYNWQTIARQTDDVYRRVAAERKQTAW